MFAGVRRWHRRRVGQYVNTWFGWPVPGRVLIASPKEMERLVRAAEVSNYSRKGARTDLDRAVVHVVVPYLPEPTPTPGWMCLVISFRHPILDRPIGERPDFAFAKLDIAETELRGLKVASPTCRDQLLHWLAWRAFSAER
ncbi:hypothetical protein [Plantactinospora sp. DSM 117369]